MANVARSLSVLVTAIKNCRKNNSPNWERRHEDRLNAIVKEYLPHGSGIDNGVRVDIERSNDEKLVLVVDFHHMNDGGYYDGWTAHTITVTASLQFEFNLKISGRDKNQIKEYLHDIFYHSLTTKVDPYKMDEACADTL